ncbi:protein kinase [Massilia sp. PAMC28688]|uniref:serine/threonine-protein kinase n=1 Tax=Massilia sp. PAMC28688 TaxID=2861283 RepID=UPI001C628623|nr:serine/threonine-protein kinase [Massilia sp. PAMC28688]QYF92514.1 protein kinase [Massilia sp. PAMC28688]
MNAQAIAGSENCLPIGTRLHDFEITGVLGEGGFGIVYIAFDHSLQRHVAIKEYMPGVLATRADDHSILVRAERHQETFNVGLKSFINEARFLAQFDHPSLVKVYRFWEQNQTAYTAMQYYDGQTIKDIVTHAPEVVNEAWCRKILQQILEALEMLYTMRILHRDVSPDNIIVQENGDAVLLDFGSARQIIGDRTRGLTVILKPGYAPVEQYAGDASLDQGAYTDIYSLSAVIYYAIMKEPPATSIARMVKDPIAPLAVRGVDGYSTEFLAAIDKGLAVMAHERPQTIDAFRELLGIKSSGAPRVRPSGNTQRFATLDRLPQNSTPTAPAETTGALPTPKPAAAPPAPGPERIVPKAAAAASAIHKPAPKWMSRAALALSVMVIIGFGASWLMGTPSDTVMPVVQADAPVLPDAAPALPDAAPAVVEAPVPPPTADNVTPAAALDEAVAAAPAADQPGVDAILGTPPASPAPADTKPETASYRLQIKPWGTIYVDGKQKGVSPPLKRLVLPAGQHKIRVVNPNFPDYFVEVNLAKNKSGTIEHDFAARAK